MREISPRVFLEAIEKDFFDATMRRGLNFEPFLEPASMVSSPMKQAASRLKRGGDATILSLDFDGAEEQLKIGLRPAPNTIDDYFEKEWARSVFSLALESFRPTMVDSGKETHLKLFERYVLDADDGVKTSYKGLASEFNLSTSDVTNYLALARREFRRIVLEKLRELTATDEEYRREARALLGTDPL